MTTIALGSVEVVYWNPPLRHLPSPFGRIRYGRRTNNFGDLLGPLIAAHLSGHSLERSRRGGRGRRLLTVGSILPLARTGDVVWGSGMNGKQASSDLKFVDLQVHSVRGPLTAELLVDRGIAVPSVYGDPGLLAASLFPEITGESQNADLRFVPNFHELGRFEGEVPQINPLGDPISIMQQMARSGSIAASSLHGVVVAESLGIPAVLIRPVRETLFKYRDYYEGTGRRDFPVAENIRHAREILVSGEISPPVFDAGKLLEAFPQEMWTCPKQSPVDFETYKGRDVK